MKFIRKPIVTTFALLTVISIIYFMTSSSSEASLGSSSPINLSKNGVKEGSLDLVNQKQKAENIVQQQQTKQEQGQTAEEDPEVIKRPTKQQKQTEEAVNEEFSILPVNEITDTPFMPKMANETLKAQLGNAAWKLFHTILARYPDKPSKQEQTTLQQYIILFSQVYPCGDCARHFQHLLAKYPPQTGSRKTAALWGCDIHNKVNDRLHKPSYDCTTILEDYDCGCGEDEKEKDFTLGNESLDHIRTIKVDEKEEGLQLGG